MFFLTRYSLIRSAEIVCLLCHIFASFSSSTCAEMCLSAQSCAVKRRCNEVRQEMLAVVDELEACLAAQLAAIPTEASSGYRLRNPRN